MEALGIDPQSLAPPQPAGSQGPPSPATSKPRGEPPPTADPQDPVEARAVRLAEQHCDYEAIKKTLVAECGANRWATAKQSVQRQLQRLAGADGRIAPDSGDDQSAAAARKERKRVPRACAGVCDGTAVCRP